ncbi:PREDICTED: leucine-rich repeat receptor-like serine/threonine-protein kinase BAM2 [Theobroma cacao]|uniref:Leucine-rich repeat receptor-like serine/threonine-protein kinase BAM2 n=1 Tax=Theobroma cacao TaxID=3641 RepID=A0AB32WXS6_THECC|nr:PREDICTED: leucine-rich repeat receptor-like serine/threonine-protein kinase BAM2 [Theobroma cacao]
MASFLIPFQVLFFLMLVPLQSSIVFASLAAAAPAKEAETLLKWKASLDNKSQTLLSSWLGDSHCNWVGITCDEAGSMTNLSLPNYVEGLRGNIPSEICLLKSLELISLSNNRITGSIPQEIGRLSSVSNIFFYDNNLSGPIPTSIGSLHNLTALDLKLA